MRMPVNLTQLIEDVIRAHANKVRRALDCELEERPKYAAKTDLVAGDRVFSGTLEDEGFCEGIVVADSGGFAQYIEVGGEVASDVRWVSVNCSKTLAEALKRAAEWEVSYSLPRLQYAQEVLSAIEAGDDLSRFMAPKEFEN